jgi:phosphopantetheinyl transferase
MPAHSRAKSFFAGWTRKEAIVKARGVTMAESLTTLSVDVDPEAIHPGYVDSPEAGPRPRCRLVSLFLADPNLIGAVALCSGRLPRLRVRVPEGPRFD